MALVFPVEVYPADATVDALSGTTHQQSGVKYVSKDLGKSSAPSLAIQHYRERLFLLDRLSLACAARVVETGALAVGVFPVTYRQGGADKQFDGATAQAVVDNDTNYVYLNSSAALVINITGFPADATTYFPLAEVVAANGVLTITDKRSLVLFAVNQLAGSYALDDLSNLAAGGTSVNKSLLPSADNAIDLGSGTKSWRVVYVGNQIIFKGTSFNIVLGFADPAAGITITVPDAGGDDTLALVALAQTLLNKTLDGMTAKTDITLQSATADITIDWDVPAAARAYTIPDVGVGADFVLTDGAQTLGDKTLTAPTIDDLTNATHDHSNAAGGGNLTKTAFASAKLFPVAPSFYKSGALAVEVLKWEYVAPFAMTLRSATGRVNTAPVGDSMIVDVRVGGASIFASQAEMINIADGTQQGVSTTKDHDVAAGDVITLEVEQVGSTTAGSDLAVVLNCLAVADSV